MPKAVTHGRRTCTVDVSPGEVDAGTELTVTVRLTCAHGCDLAGQGVSIRDRDDVELARAEFTQCAGEAHTTSALIVRAPLKAGEHVWRAVLAPHEQGGVLHEASSTEFSFVTTAHAASVNAWGMPSAIAAGERFSFKIGVKCSAACNLGDRPLLVLDHQDAQVAEARLRRDVWPGTTALHFAEIEAKAPPCPGDYAWRVRTPGSDADIPHADGSCTFSIKVVRAPDHEVTVAAFDGDTQAPVAGVHVLLHPFRTFTDAHGVAKVKVAKGRYTLVVSGFNYIAYETVIDVTGDITARAELTVEPEGQEDYR